MNIAGRVAALERGQAESGPLVLFGELTPVHRREIEDAQRAGRRVILWPVAPPPIERAACAARACEGLPTQGAGAASTLL